MGGVGVASMGGGAALHCWWRGDNSDGQQTLKKINIKEVIQEKRK